MNINVEQWAAIVLQAIIGLILGVGVPSAVVIFLKRWIKRRFVNLIIEVLSGFGNGVDVKYDLTALNKKELSAIKAELISVVREELSALVTEVRTGNQLQVATSDVLSSPAYRAASAEQKETIKKAAANIRIFPPAPPREIITRKLGTVNIVNEIAGEDREENDGDEGGFPKVGL